jgi:hypothetical protein
VANEVLEIVEPSNAAPRSVDAKKVAPEIDVERITSAGALTSGERGFVATTTTNWDRWSVDQIGGSPKPNLGAIGCPSTTRCVAVGDTVFAGSGL